MGKSIFYKIALSLVLLLSCFKVTAQEDPRDSIFTIEPYISDYAELLDFYNREYSKNPKDWWANYRLGRHYLYLNEDSIAVSFLDSAIKFNPVCAVCLAWKAEYFLTNGDTKNAKILLDQSEALNTEEYWVSMALGEYFTKIGNLGMAEIKFNDAIRLEKTASQPHYALAQINLQKNYQVTAIKQLDIAIQKDSMVSSYYYERGKVYYQINIFEAAEADLKKAISLDSNNKEFLIGYGAVIYRFNRVEEALALVNKAWEIDSSNYQIYYNRSIYYYALEKMDEYCDDIRSAKRFAPKENRESIINGIDSSLRYTCDPSRVSYYYQRGIASYNLGKYEDALAWYFRGLEKFPDHASTLSFVGNAYMALQKYPEAIVAYQRSLDLSLQLQGEYIESGRENPDYDASTAAIGYQLSNYYSVSQCFLYLDKIDSAKIYMDKIAPFEYKMNERSPGLFQSLKGMYAMYTGNFDEAIKAYNNAYFLSDGNPEYLLSKAIAKVYKATNKKLRITSIKFESSTVPSRMAVFPIQSLGKEEELRSALEDCNKALAVAPNLLDANFIRGQIRRLLKDPNYCEDFKVIKKALKDFNTSEFGCP